MSDVLCVIPSRFGAQRFPRKPLAPLGGKPMVQWALEAARRVPEINEVLVATDDERIRAAVEAAGGRAVMTSPDLPSGTDRIAAALGERECDAVVNVQGDEPFMRPETVSAAIRALLEDETCDVSTACAPIRDRETFENPAAVKVVRGEGDTALYFSRAPIPSAARLGSAEIAEPGFLWGYKHLGLYVYRPEALRTFVTLPPSRLELREKLEQLRFLEAGFRIRCVDTPYDSIGIDTPEDLERAAAMLR